MPVSFLNFLDITTYPNAAALTAVDTSTLPNGMYASVTDLGVFQLQKNSSSTVDGTTVIAGDQAGTTWNVNYNMHLLCNDVSEIDASQLPVGSISKIDVTCTAAALATAGRVTVVEGSGTKRYIVRSLFVNVSTGLSGGGGDRLLRITDGTNNFNANGITAALLGTAINTPFGGSGNPVASIAQSTASVAGADIYLVYAGGTTDFTTGQVVVTVEIERFA